METPKKSPELHPRHVERSDSLCRVALARMQSLWPFACRLGESLSIYEDTDDLWQDVTVRLWRKISSGDLDAAFLESPQFVAYARRALLRRYLEIVRFHSMKKRDRLREVTIEDLHESVSSVGSDPSFEMADNEALMLALEEIPAEWRTVIRGKYLEGRTLKEAGEEAGLSSVAISKGLSKRMAQLRAILQRYDNESR